MAKRKTDLGRAGIERYLRERPECSEVMLFTLSVVADEAAGRELFPSLGPYERLLPQGARSFWASKGQGGSLWVVSNPYANVASQVRETAAPMGFFDTGVDIGPESILASGR